MDLKHEGPLDHLKGEAQDEAIKLGAAGVIAVLLLSFLVGFIATVGSVLALALFDVVNL